MKRFEPAAVVFLLLAFIVACGLQITATSPVYDEPVHLASGYSCLRWNDYRLNAEHPPLVKKIAALPLLFMNVTPREVPSIESKEPSLQELGYEWGAALADPGAEWIYAHTFVYGMKSEALSRLGRRGIHEVRGTDAVTRADYFHDVDRMFTAARSMIVLFGVGLALLVYFWTRELFGPAGALLALAMFCFEPNVIAHSSLVTTDVPIALCIFGAIYFYWRCLTKWSRANAIAFVLFTATAFIVKFTAFVLVPMLVVLLIAKFSRRGLAIIAIAGVATWLAIWAAYGFRFNAAGDRDAAAANEAAITERRPFPPIPDRAPGTFPLEHALRSHAADATFYAENRRMPSEAEAETAYRYASIRGGSKLLQSVARMRLVPEAYAYGLAFARQRSVFRPSYLRGNYSDTGFTSYFFWTLLFKTPLVTLLLVALGIAAFTRTSDRRFIVIPAAIFLLTALSANLNIGHRHLLPLLPFLFVMAGALGRKIARPAFAAVVFILLFVSSFVVFSLAGVAAVPRNRLAYINEVGGGPLEGYRNLVDSNFDWGQDLKTLATWTAAHEPARPINLSYFGTADPKYYGIRHRNLFLGYEYEPDDGPDALTPGIVAVSATSLIGIAPGSEISRFLAETKAEPVGRAGPSILLYKAGIHP